MTIALATIDLHMLLGVAPIEYTRHRALGPSSPTLRTIRTRLCPLAPKLTFQSYSQESRTAYRDLSSKATTYDRTQSPRPTTKLKARQSHTLLYPGFLNMSTHKDAYPCIICPAHFASKPEQADHLATAHNFDRPWLCYQCSDSFQNKDGLEDHEVTAHLRTGRGDEDHSCTVHACGLNLASEKMLVRHRQQDHTQQAVRMGKGLPRGCNQPGCQYTNESCVAFSVHALHQHQPKCAFCGAKFEEFSELVKHREGPGKDGACVPTVIEPQTIAESSGTASISNGATKSEHLLPPPPPPIQASPHRSQGPSGGYYSSDNRGEGSARNISDFYWTPGSGGRAFAADPYHLLPNVPLGDGVGGYALLPPVQLGYGTWQPPQVLPSFEIMQPRAVQAFHPSQPPARPQPLWVEGACAGSHTHQSESVIDYDPVLWPPLDYGLGERQQQQQPEFVADPPLPHSVYTQGFTDEDFNPNRTWPVQPLNRSRYREYPVDLQDIHIFNGNPDFISYGNILRLATRYKNRQIFALSNKYRVRPVIQTPAALDNRVRSAVAWAAKEWEMPGGIDGVWAWLGGEKQKNCLKAPVRRRKHEDDEQTQRRAGDTGGRLGASPTKRTKTAEAFSTSPQPPMPPMQTPSVPVVQETLISAMQIPLEAVREVIAPVQTAPTPTRTMFLPTIQRRDTYGLLGSLYHTHVKGRSLNNHIAPARTTRVDSPMAPATPATRGEPSNVIDLTQE